MAKRHVLPSHTVAQLPTAGTAGAIAFVTDNNTIYLDDGSSWATLLTTAPGNFTITGNASIGLSGTSPYGIQDKYLIVGSSTASSIGQIGLVGSKTTNTGFAQISFHNEALGSGTRRVAMIQANRDGANNTAALEIYTAYAGTDELRLRLEADGLTGTFCGIGVDPAEYLHIRTYQHGGIALDRDANTLALDITFGTDGVVTTARDWVVRADSPGANGDIFRIMDIDGAGAAVARLDIEGMRTITANASWYGVRATTSGMTLTEAGSGTHPIIATVAIDQLTITNGAGATTAAASLYIAAAPTGITPTGGTYAIFSDAGLNRFDGDGTHIMELPADATDPTGGGGAATGRIPVKIGGATRYLAYY